MPLSEEELQHIVKMLRRAGLTVEVVQLDGAESELAADERWDAMIRRLTPAPQSEGAL